MHIVGKSQIPLTGTVLFIEEQEMEQLTDDDSFDMCIPVGASITTT